MRALVLSGGGRKGAFQVGVLSELLTGLQTIEYDYMAGTSVGALNVAKLAHAPKNCLRYEVEKLKKLWLDIAGNEDVWKHWFFFGRAAGAWKDSFYNSAPLRKLLEKHIDPAVVRAASKEAGRQLRFGVVGVGSGEYAEVTEDEEDLVTWILASSAFPGFLLPQEANGDLWVDGGARRITPLKGAIDAGCTHIDCIITSPRRTKPKSLDDNWLGTKRSGVTIALRTIELMMDELYLRDIKICEIYNQVAEAHPDFGKKVITLRVFEPPESLDDTATDSLEFGPEHIRYMIEEGRKVGKAA